MSAARIACGSRFSVALGKSGELWSWGEGGCGQLGFGRVTKADIPVRVADSAPDGSPFTDVACGWAHAIALSRSRAVYAWGLNCKGQLGVGDTKARCKPHQVRVFARW